VKTYMACGTCGCTDVHVMDWVHVNTNEPQGDDGVSDDVWCCQCETHYDWGDLVEVTKEKPVEES